LDVILAKNWWSLIIRGIAAIALGLIAVLWHGITFGALITLFIGYTMMDGLAAFAGAVRAVEADQLWGPLVLEGIAGIGTGIVTLAWQGVTELKLIYVIAAWALITGALEIMSALRLRVHVNGEWLLALSGFASLLLGVLMIALPLAGPMAIAQGIGAYALIFGALLIALGYRLRSWARTPSVDRLSGYAH
jgi:uncharacterized membrane protein HdeD (DUF308 family)